MNIIYRGMNPKNVKYLLKPQLEQATMLGSCLRVGLKKYTQKYGLSTDVETRTDKYQIMDIQRFVD